MAPPPGDRVPATGRLPPESSPVRRRPRGDPSITAVPRRTHVGKRCCGASRFERRPASRPPWRYCHCRSRRSWSGGPSPQPVSRMRSIDLAVAPEAVRVRRRAAVRPSRRRRSASRQTAPNAAATCGPAPPLGLVDVIAATIPALAFKPGVHVNYAETMLPMRDGLPKLERFGPNEFGGSGETHRRIRRATSACLGPTPSPGCRPRRRARSGSGRSRWRRSRSWRAR